MPTKKKGAKVTQKKGSKPKHKAPPKKEEGELDAEELDGVSGGIIVQRSIGGPGDLTSTSLQTSLDGGAIVSPLQAWVVK